MNILATIGFSNYNCYDSAQIFEALLPNINTPGYTSFRKAISYLLLPVMIVFTFQSCFAFAGQADSIQWYISNGKDVAGTTAGAAGWKQIESYNYTPYGQAVDYSDQQQLRINNEKLRFADNPFQYSGYYQDFETMMYYLNARYYSPEIMRFINRDTYDLANRYAYGNGNPISNLDPSGHSAWSWLKKNIIPHDTLSWVNFGLLAASLAGLGIAAIGEAMGAAAGEGSMVAADTVNVLDVDKTLGEAEAYEGENGTLQWRWHSTNLIPGDVRMDPKTMICTMGSDPSNPVEDMETVRANGVKEEMGSLNDRRIMHGGSGGELENAPLSKFHTLINNEHALFKPEVKIVRLWDDNLEQHIGTGYRGDSGFNDDLCTKAAKSKRIWRFVHVQSKYGEGDSFFDLNKGKVTEYEFDKIQKKWLAIR